QGVLARWASEYPVLRRTELADPSSGFVAGVISDASAFLRASILPYAGASVVVMALYLAARPELYRAGLLSLVPPRHRAVGAHILADAGATLRAWVVGQLLAMLV